MYWFEREVVVQVWNLKAMICILFGLGEVGAREKLYTVGLGNYKQYDKFALVSKIVKCFSSKYLF
ncbi:hypothetical protein Lal_00034136 [Lupinus albus]|nr:hypothetical protein Lal_00034136 [Lupinus albus]